MFQRSLTIITSLIVLRLYWSEGALPGEMYGYINIDEEVKKQNIRMSTRGKLSLRVKEGCGFYKRGLADRP